MQLEKSTFHRRYDLDWLHVYIILGWLVSIPLGFLNVYFAYAAWIVWPNLVGMWGNHQRNKLQVVSIQEGNRDTKKKARTKSSSR